MTPVLGDGDWRTTKWRIETRNLDTNATDETTCSAVMVCNGYVYIYLINKTYIQLCRYVNITTCFRHYFKPRVPKILGIQTFPGRVMHSHLYRKPEEFVNKTVVVLGASSSGGDISIEIAQYGAKTVYLSHNKPK